MNWLDLILIILLVAAFFRGMQSGFVQQFFSTLGVFVGIFLGAWLQGFLIDLVHSPQSKALLALIIVLSGAIFFMTLGEFLGLRLKNRFERVGLAKKADRLFGSIMAVVSIIVAVWLGSAIFNKVPVMSLRQQIQSSRIVATINSVLPSAPSFIAQIGHFINPNGFPQVFAGLEPKLKTDAPLPELGELLAAVEHARPSVVKVTGQGCGGIVEGTGFVAADGLVITNAHVVAGVPDPMVIDSSGDHEAQIVWFDTNVDLAVLRASGLVGAPLVLNTQRVADDTKGVVLGFPGGAGFTASPAVVLETFTATGRNIYNQGTTQRSVQSVKADIRQGNSGGPLVAADGSVIGVVFAESTSYPDVGYTLIMDQVVDVLNQAKNATKTTVNGACAQ